MAVKTNKNVKINGTKPIDASITTKVGTKRAMEESEEEDDDISSDEEINMQILKKLSKKIKTDTPSDEDSDELDDEDSSDEMDDEEDDDDEEDEEEASKPTTIKPVAGAKINQPIAKQQQSNGIAPPHPDCSIVNSNAVLVCNLDKNVIGESLKNLLASKSGVTTSECYVSYKPSAIITTQNKHDAEKIVSACQSVLYQGNQLQLSNISSGIVPKSKLKSRKDLEEIEPAKSFLVYSMKGNVNKDEVQKICGKAVEVYKSNSGVYVTFENVQDSKESFLRVAKLDSIQGSTIMVKYIRNNLNNMVWSGKEDRLFIFNVVFATSMKDMEELVPKASFLHYNPVAHGSWIAQFASPKDCKESGDRLNNYEMQGRRLRIVYAPLDSWELKINAKSNIKDAQQLFNNNFPDMVDMKVMTQKFKSMRTPSFVLMFKTRDIWLRALEKANKLKSIGGVQVFMPNYGKHNPTAVTKKGDKTPTIAAPAKQVLPAKKEDKKPKIAASVKQVVPEKKEDSDEENDDEDDDSGDEPMEEDDNSVDAEGSDDEEEGDDDDEDSEQEEDEEKPQAKPMNTFNKRGGSFTNGRGNSPNNRGRGDGHRGRGGFAPRGGAGFSPRGGAGFSPRGGGRGASRGGPRGGGSSRGGPRGRGGFRGGGFRGGRGRGGK